MAPDEEPVSYRRAAGHARTKAAAFRKMAADVGSEQLNQLADHYLQAAATLHNAERLGTSSGLEPGRPAREKAF